MSVRSEKVGRLKDIWVISPGIGRTKYRVISTDCIGCRYCESACSYFYEGIANPRLSRIKIVTKDVEWQKHERDTINTQIVCKQCPGVSPCILACPVEGAIERHPKTGAVIINDKICIRCRACEQACPYGPAVYYNKWLDKMLKCTLCDGEPKCVEFCPVGVLKYVKLR